MRLQKHTGSWNKRCACVCALALVWMNSLLHCRFKKALLMVIFSMLTHLSSVSTLSLVLSLSPPLPLSLALFPFICLSLWKGAYSFYISGWCLCIWELDKGSGFVLNLLLWCGTLFSVSFFRFLCTFFIYFFSVWKCFIQSNQPMGLEWQDTNA